MPESFAVIDFETTGLSPTQGDRATEIAAVIVEGGRVVDRFVSLINPQRHIPSYVQSLTGITDEMVAKAPLAKVVMKDCVEFVGQRYLVAHNASFDRRFWQAETAPLRIAASNEFLCTMLLARRMYPDAPNHKLGALQQHLHIQTKGKAHRALADAEMASEVLFRIEQDLRLRYRLTMTSNVLQQIQATSAASVAMTLRALAR